MKKILKFILVLLPIIMPFVLEEYVLAEIDNMNIATYSAPVNKNPIKPRFKKLEDIRVVDGDTVKGHSSGEPYYIRILRIDCHETSYNSRADFQHELYNMPYEEIYKKGKIEKEYLEKIIKINKNNIYFEDNGKDVYGRTLGEIYIGSSLNVSDLLLKNNICPKYVPRSRKKY